MPAGETPSGWEGRPLASWGSRVGATLLDVLILTVPIAVVIAVIVVVAFSSDVGAVALGIFLGLAYLVAAFLYAPVLMSREGGGNGQTWGKQIVGIRAVRDGGQPFDFGSAFLREFVIKGLLFGTVGGWFLGIPDGARLPLAALGRREPLPARHGRQDPRRQGLSQAAAGRRRSAAPAQIISSRPGPTPTITIGRSRKSEMNSR
jgi:uncharacterized RDD family membrane protein YckC